MILQIYLIFDLFFDMGYLFYRMNRAYEYVDKKKWVVQGGPVEIIAAKHMMYIAVFCWRFADLFFNANHKSVFACLFVGIAIVDYILLNRKYNEKKIATLKKKYRNDWRNKAVGTWLIFAIVFLQIVFAFLIASFISVLLERAIEKFHLLPI